MSSVYDKISTFQKFIDNVYTCQQCLSDPSVIHDCIANKFYRLNLPIDIAYIITSFYNIPSELFLFNPIPKELDIIELDIFIDKLNHVNCSFCIYNTTYVKNNPRFNLLNYLHLKPHILLKASHVIENNNHHIQVSNVVRSKLAILKTINTDNSVGEINKTDKKWIGEYKNDNQSIKIDYSNYVSSPNIIGPRKVEISLRGSKYCNKSPTWNNLCKAHFLSFANNRIKHTSVTNCLFEHPINDLKNSPIDNSTNYFYQFGVVKNNGKFAMDIGYPLSIMDGFMIALSQIYSRY